MKGMLSDRTKELSVKHMDVRWSMRDERGVLSGARSPLRHCRGRRRCPATRRSVWSFGRKVSASSSPRRTTRRARALRLRPLTNSALLLVTPLCLTPNILTYFAVCKNHLQKILVSFVFFTSMYIRVYFIDMYIHNSMFDVIRTFIATAYSRCCGATGSYVIRCLRNVARLRHDTLSGHSSLLRAVRVYLF